MRNAIVKSMFYLTIMFTFALTLSAKEFEVINGNGALSHDQKWYIKIEVGLYNESPYIRFEVINLNKNNFAASPFFLLIQRKMEKKLSRKLFYIAKKEETQATQI